MDVYRLAIAYVVGKALDEAESQNRKTELDRMAAMLSRLGGRGYQVRESEEAYTAGEEEVDPDPDSDSDPDPDSDSDLDETKPQQGGGGAAMRDMVGGWWLVVDGWWLMVDGWWAGRHKVSASQNYGVTRSRSPHPQAPPAA